MGGDDSEEREDSLSAWSTHVVINQVSVSSRLGATSSGSKTNLVLGTESKAFDLYPVL